jgi:hypothetical protein
VAKEFEDTKGVSRPNRATFGPYMDVEISDEKIFVTDGGEGQSFELAVQESDGWWVNDGMNQDGTCYEHLRFHTYHLPEADADGRGKK